MKFNQTELFVIYELLKEEEKRLFKEYYSESATNCETGSWIDQVFKLKERFLLEITTDSKS
jgi:hypothetical protein